MPDDSDTARRMRILAGFGEFVLRSDDVDEILAEACRLVAAALGTRHAKILEIVDSGRTLFVRAGTGWGPDIVGRVRLSMQDPTSESYSIALAAPVIAHDLRQEPRFPLPDFMTQAGVLAFANVPILLPGGKPYGLLQVDDLEPHEFTAEDTDFLRTYAVLLGPVIDRQLKLSQLRATEERYRLIIDTALDYAILIVDPDDIITDWLPGAAAVFGWSAEEAIGQPSAILFTPGDREAGEARRELDRAGVDGVAPDIRWHVRKDGGRVFIEGSVRALRDANGALRGFLKIGKDVTERRAAEQALQESQERFRQFGEASPDVLWTRGAQTLAFDYVSPACAALYGRSRHEMLAQNSLESFLELVHPEDRERFVANLHDVVAGENRTHEFRIRQPNDGERWVRNTDFPLRDAAGQIARIAGVAQDITDEKTSAARLEVLVAELQHRARNLLGVISSVAGRTLEQGGSVHDFRVRLQALSRAHSLLSQSGTDTVDVGSLVRAELAVHAEPGRPTPTIAGPPVNLTSRQVQNFALALHELTTNAVKYGALKGEGGGELSVTWSVAVDASGHRRLTLDWAESGIPIAPEQATRRGYGRELIENALSYALRAKTEYVLAPDGVRCRIDLPLA